MDDQKSINRNWHLADSLTVQQAAALIADCDPNIVSFDESGQPLSLKDETGLTSSDRLNEVKTAFWVLVNAINDKSLNATVRRSARIRGWNEEPQQDEQFTKDVDVLPSDIEESNDDWFRHSVKTRGIIYRVTPDWGKTTVTRRDLTAWLSGRGIRSGFFFPDATDQPDYLDENNPRYAPKLAAAVRAWQAVTHPAGKSPKQALSNWLREHAVELGLIDGKNNPNETGIEEISKVANWQGSGGAPRTPGN
jgi:hypothetical protein